jgi:hypothetical protein
LLPILGSATMKLSGLVRISRVDIGEEDVLGVRLPALKAVEFVTAHYSLLATPFWIDDLVTCLKEVATYRIRLHVYRERAARMQSAVPAHHSACQLIRQSTHPQCQTRHRSHSDFPLGCWAGRGSNFEDRKRQTGSAAGGA